MVMVGIVALVLAFQNHVAWEPRTKLLPAPFVKAVQFLLSHGISDPRGCELRIAKYASYVPGDYYSGLGLNAYAWVRPGYAKGETQVITPYGIPVKAFSVGPHALTSKLISPLLSLTRGQSTNHLNLNDGTILSLVMMAIHGEEELVAKALRLISDYSKFQYDQIPVLALSAYKFALSNQALNAFARGDDALAAMFCNQALNDLAEFEKFEMEHKDSFPDHRGTSFFDFMKETKSVSKELVRRTHLPTKNILSATEIASKPIDEQVSILIEQLPEAGNPNFPELEWHLFYPQSIGRRLLEIGQPAVPRLLAALDTNERLTRSQPMARSGPTRRLPLFVSVKSTVRTVLLALEFRNFYETADDKIHEYWQQNLGKQDFQRIYETLTNDSATNRWAYAALALLQSKRNSLPPLQFGIGTSFDIQDIVVRPEMSAALNHANPSVSDLILKRLSASSKILRDDRSDLYEVDKALSFALTSYYIDSEKCLPALQMASKSFLSSLSSSKTLGYYYSSSHFGAVVEARKRLGDQSYASDMAKYATHLRQHAPVNDLEAAKYFVMRISDPAVAESAKGIFFDPSSQFSIRGFAKSNPMFLGVVATDLLNLPECRTETFKLLGNKSEIDSKFIESRASMRMVYDDDGQFWRSGPKHAYGIIRVCDLVAMSLVRVQGCPTFSLDWSVARRDQSIRSLRIFVQNLGTRKINFRDQNWLGRIIL